MKRDHPGIQTASLDGMIAGPKKGKVFLTILLHGHTPERFLSLREQRFRRMYASTHANPRHREKFDASDPAIHRYNDIAGFAELYWDGGTRILSEMFLRGDRRRKYRKEVAKERRPETLSPNKFYPLYVTYVEAGGINHPRKSSEAEMRQALRDSLEWVHAEAANLGCYVDLAHEEAILEALDVRQFFS